ncbi:hypothetical protein V3C99_010553 [Haemonchus contortus]
MFEPADGLFGTFITEEWIVNEFARSHGVQISHLKFQRIGETEGSFSRVCLMECESNGRLPRKLIVKIPTCLTYVENRRRRGWTHGDYSHIRDLLITYHNTETLFYQHAGGVVGVPQIFLSRPFCANDYQGIICMEYLENARTRPVHEDISVDEMKSILALYANIQKGCTSVPDDVRSRLNTNVFELLSPTTLSLETLTQRLNRMSLWRPEITSTFQKLVELLPKILDHHLISRLHSECPHQHLLVHGDLYSSNILWQNGTVKTVIDYQMAHYGNPVEDLVRLFTTGLTASERKARTCELLDYYRTQITSLIAGLEQTFTSDWLFSCYKRIFPMAGLWAIVSLHASFESSTSQEPPDSSKLDRITKKIHGIAAEIVGTVSCLNDHQ